MKIEVSAAVDLQGMTLDLEAMRKRRLQRQLERKMRRIQRLRQTLESLQDELPVGGNGADAR